MPQRGSHRTRRHEASSMAVGTMKGATWTMNNRGSDDDPSHHVDSPTVREVFHTEANPRKTPAHPTTKTVRQPEDRSPRRNPLVLDGESAPTGEGGLGSAEVDGSGGASGGGRSLISRGSVAVVALCS